jgi:hypothetical protein
MIPFIYIAFMFMPSYILEYHSVAQFTVLH